MSLNLKIEKERSSEKHSDKGKDPSSRDSKERSERKNVGRLTNETSVTKSTITKNAANTVIIESKREINSG